MCEWEGKKWYLPRSQHKVLKLLHAHKENWVTPIRIEMVLWPAALPDTSRNIISQLISKLRNSLMGTSVAIEGMAESHVHDLGYRMTGDVDWIKMS